MSPPRSIVEDFDDIRARQEGLTPLPVASDDEEFAGIAAMEFEPLAPETVARLLAALSKPYWNGKLPSYRLALTMLGRSKEELAAGGKSEVQHHMDFADYLGEQKEWLRGLAEFIGAAQARIIVALHAIAEEGDA